MKEVIIILLSILLAINIFVNKGLQGDDPREVIIEKFKSNYPGSEILEIKQDDQLLKIQFNSGDGEQYVIYTRDGEWIETGQVIESVKLPEKIWIAFSESPYSLFKIEKILFIQNPESPEYYRFVLNTDQNLKIVAYDMEGLMLTLN